LRTPCDVPRAPCLLPFIYKYHCCDHSTIVCTFKRWKMSLWWHTSCFAFIIILTGIRKFVSSGLGELDVHIAIIAYCYLHVRFGFEENLLHGLHCLTICKWYVIWIGIDIIIIIKTNNLRGKFIHMGVRCNVVNTIPTIIQLNSIWGSIQSLLTDL
jgi:hypothetical protein